MVIKKVKKIIRKKLYEYPIYDRLINELELEKDTTEGRDINSSIRSKNKISRTTEGQVIKNISIDVKINEYKKINPNIRTYLGASKGKESFYEKFGFITRPNAELGSGMILY